jgi:3-deoxy-D-manno-octulosonic-acid transferase
MICPNPLDLPSLILQEAKMSLWWVAGSTHPGEEEIVLDVYKRSLKIILNGDWSSHPSY